MPAYVTKAAAAPRRRAPAAAAARFQAPEPLIEHPDKPAKQNGKAPVRRPARKPAAKAVPPAPADPDRLDEVEVTESAAEPDVEPGRPTTHNGVAVVREELRRNLPSGAAFKISRLHLIDGTLAFACRDCDFTADTNVIVQRHRNADHGTRYGKRTPKVVYVKDTQLDDVILPPRGDVPAPTNPMEMTLAEFLAVAPSYAALSDLVDRTERERDAAIEKLIDMQQENKDAQHALAVYPTLQAEVVELRLMVRNAGSYEELKAEVLELRAFKKKITQHLGRMGSMIDEDSKE